MEKDFLPLLGRAEQYIEPTSKKLFGGEKVYPRSYEEAKVHLIKNLNSLKRDLSETSEKYKLNEYVVCVRMEKGFKAKSYYPSTLNNLRNITNVGARAYYLNNDTSNKKNDSKLYFMKVNDNWVNDFGTALLDDRFTTEAWQNDMQSIHSIDILKPFEKISNFDDGWNFGTVEIVLHPFGIYNNIVIEKLLSLIDNSNNKNKFKIKEYEDGPIFISAKIDRIGLEKLANFNPLRTVHPLRSIDIPELRSYMDIAAPFKEPQDKTKSIIKIGVFDGGAVIGVPFLKNYVNNEDLTNMPISQSCVSHGTAVCGAVLYGSLNDYKDISILPTPSISVENFRVFPTSDPADIDLYEVIDYIEDIVPKRNDISIYNLSLGPKGPIIDDQISRFTYSLDKLSIEHNVLFIVAVGNDGNLPAPHNRIQSPADLVNGLGVGAYTLRNDIKVRAPYSCVGVGREGCKVKPDLVAFGGSGDWPTYLVSTLPNMMAPSAGTSFASPIVANKIGAIMAQSSEITPQMARALLIHSSKHQDADKPDINFGHGYICDTVEEILGCSSNEVTMMYSSKVKTGKFVKLPIPFTELKDYKGSVTVKWTIVNLTDVNSTDSDGYTLTSIEDTFYPNENAKFLQFKGNKNIKIDTKNDVAKIAEYINEGYKLSPFPKSSSGNKYITEEKARLNYKWDTVVKRWNRYKISSVNKPFILLHGIGRKGYENKDINYYAIVTISLSGYAGNLYNDIINEYRLLEPIKLRNKNEIMINI
ncbi:S8 family peptidase [Clostridium tagluense]|uniref:S8 family peptidase n=1 Tax=Clostridium tagluense TaxID=360422 RepID=UPI001C0BC353|nr:S8 family peptidase [Clostridium tagluense]MBU3128490.1 S8 family peptidase [Clostridium tagluense]